LRINQFAVEGGGRMPMKKRKAAKKAAKKK